MKVLSTLLFLLAWFGPCIGQQLPKFDWAGKVGGTKYNELTSMHVDYSGNTYVTGRFQDTAADFDPGPGVHKLYNSGYWSSFIVKLNSSGALNWANSLTAVGGNNSVYSKAITVDNNGNIYITGGFWGSIDFDPGAGTHVMTSNGGFSWQDIFLAKYDSNFNFLWSRRFGNTGNDYGTAIATDKNGNVFVTGIFTGIVDFDHGSAVNTLSGSNDDIFVLKYDALGEHVWAERLGGSSNDYVNDIAVDDSANVYTTGIFRGTANFDPNGPLIVNLVASGSYDAFISKLDSNGNYKWVRQLSASDGETGKSVLIDRYGDIIVGAWFNNVMDADPTSGTYVVNPAFKGVHTYLILKLTAGGGFLWAKTSGHGSTNYFDISTDSSANLYAVGGYGDSSDFDPGPAVYMVNTTGGQSLNDQDMFICKLSKTGDFGWVRTMGSKRQGDAVVAIGTDINGNIYSAGTFTDTTDFDPGADSFLLMPPALPSSSSPLNLFVHKMYMCADPAMTNTGAALVAAAAGATYQWLNCDSSNAAIPGAIAKSFVPAYTGNYSVVVTVNGCSDTSQCVKYTAPPVGNIKNPDIDSEVQCYPNPAVNVLHIRNIDRASFIITTMTGISLHSGTVENGSAINVDALPAGMYILNLTDEGKSTKLKFVKQ